ncbi:MAG TPA: arylsulfatase [Chloroflexota bacterium]|nr:arylsulfatase [Chloroflexota bacterium]
MTSAEPGFGGVIGRTVEESTPWWPAPARSPAGAPNVVFVVLDDVGFADLGCYGSEIETPQMDRLAANGLRYTNFHTTAMCSPTRAALLTGRQPHAVGMGIIAEWSTGFPAYRGFVSPRAANLAEMLGEHGYNSFAVGKWHLMSMDDVTAAGPFTHWPLRRGFDRWYGFHGALADSWHPELFEDNHAVDHPPRAPQATPLPAPEGGEVYHLSEDLVDRAIGFIRDQQSAAPERPFFLYLAFGAAHWPHQVPKAYVEKYRGRFDRGWDSVREARLARQIELGIVPPETELAPRNPGVKAWDALSADEQRLFARMQEVYAGFVDHTDAQIGRLVSYLDALGKLDDTLIVLLSDNGASPEGGPVGAVNARKHLQYEPETLEENLTAIDRLGDETTYGHYPMGWAQASNTPLKWYKKDVHAGGARDPLIVHWPARIKDGGTLRHQFHHVVDLTPTVLDLLGIEAPVAYRGEAQLPVHGTSLAYTFDRADAPTRKATQYFELLGDRGLWHDGWKAVARHEKGTDFEQDRWELYHLDRDFSECHDLSAEQPEKLEQLVQRWWTEAGKYGVLPLDDREYERVAASVAARARKRYVYYPGMARIDRFSAPDVTDRSYTITAEIELPDGGAEGVLLESGACFGGHVLYVNDGRLVYEYAFSERERTRIVGDAPLPFGRCRVQYAFRKTGTRQGTGTLLVDGREVGTAALPKTWPTVGVTAGLRCGRGGPAPISDGYPAPFPFTGIIHRVVVELGNDGAGDLSASYQGALAEE